MSRGVKLYVAMMAAAEVGCQYFVSYFTAKYLEVGGDSGWLKGIQKTPGKLQRIAVLNRKMVQEPWRESMSSLHNSDPFPHLEIPAVGCGQACKFCEIKNGHLKAASSRWQRC